MPCDRWCNWTGDISSHWKQHFDKLLNIYANCDNSLKSDVLSNFDSIEHNFNNGSFDKSVWYFAY